MDNSNNSGSSNISDNPPASAPTDSWPTSNSTPSVNPDPNALGSANVSSAPTWPSLSESSLPPTPPTNSDTPSLWPSAANSSSPAWPSDPVQPSPAPAPVDPTPATTAFPPVNTAADPVSSWVSPTQDTSTAPAAGTWPTPAVSEPLPSDATQQPTTFPSEAGTPAVQPITDTPIPPQNQTTAWPTPAVSEPLPSDQSQIPETPTAPISDNTSTPDPASVWNSPAQRAAEPTPTFTPAPPLDNVSSASPSTNTSPIGGAEPALSPLDNPWGTPPQAPPIEQPQTNSAQPSWTGIPEGHLEQQANTPPPTATTEAAPTDLSHLISNNQPDQATIPSTENLFVPSAAPQTPEVPNLPKAHGTFPKWLLAVGGLLLVIVVGASAYFILGIGQPTETTSIPATTVPKTAESSPPPAEPTTQPSAQSSDNTSSNFGALQGNSGSQNQGTSAAELLRQRQQQQAR